MTDDVFQLPGEAPVTLTAPIEGGAAELTLSSVAELGRFTLTVGSMNGAPGRFIAVIHGLVIGEGDEDLIQVGQGPLASRAPLYVYMVAAQGTRLDPWLRLPDRNEDAAVCDDVGQRGCEAVPSPEGLRVHMAAQQVDIEADRFDAGATLPPGTGTPHLWKSGTRQLFGSHHRAVQYRPGGRTPGARIVARRHSDAGLWPDGLRGLKLPGDLLDEVIHLHSYVMNALHTDAELRAERLLVVGEQQFGGVHTQAHRADRFVLPQRYLITTGRGRSGTGNRLVNRLPHHRGKLALFLAADCLNLWHDLVQILTDFIQMERYAMWHGCGPNILIITNYL